jgi:hypothetical protein
LGFGTGGVVVAGREWGPVGRGSGALPLRETQGEETPCTVVHIGARDDRRRGRQFDGNERAATIGAPELEIEELATVLVYVAACGARGPETRIRSPAHREARVTPP